VAPELADVIMEEAAGTAGNAPLTFYRGDQAGLTGFQSYAARAGGQANSEAVLASGELDDLMATARD